MPEETADQQNQNDSNSVVYQALLAAMNVSSAGPRQALLPADTFLADTSSEIGSLHGMGMRFTPAVLTGSIDHVAQAPAYCHLKSGPQANYAYRPTPASVLPYIQKGTVVCFYNGGNHLQMCTGFKNGEPIWVSDTKQGPHDTNFFPNGMDEHCQYAVFQPGANFDVDKAVKNLENMAARNEDYTGNCATYVRVGALEVGVGKAVAPSSTGNASGYNNGLLEHIGFTRSGEGSGSRFVPTTVTASRSIKSPSATANV